MGTGSFPGVRCSWGVMLTPHPFLVPRSKTEWSYTSTLPKSLRGLWKGETYLHCVMYIHISLASHMNVCCFIKLHSVKKYFCFPRYLRLVFEPIMLQLTSYTVENCVNKKFCLLLLVRLIYMRITGSTCYSYDKCAYACSHQWVKWIYARVCQSMLVLLTGSSVQDLEHCF